MLLQVDKSRVLDAPKIFFGLWWGEVPSSVVGEYDKEELEGEWCRLVFKAGKDIADESNVDISSSWWVKHLEREE